MIASLTSTRSSRRLVTLFVLALAIKIGFLIAARDNPFVLGLTNDESYHVEEATAILGDGLLRDDAFYFAPLYPYLLAVLFSVVGQRIWTVLGLQIALGAVNAIVVLTLAERATASRRAGWLAAALTVLFGPYYMYEALVLKSTLAVVATNLALLLLLVALDRNSSRLWLGCGLVFGVLTLLRGNLLVILPFVFAGLVLEHRRRRVTPSGLALWLVGILCGILPATVHNAVVAADFVPTTYQGGTNFFIGNHRGASGTYASLRPGRGHPLQEKYDAVTLAEEAAGRTLWPSEVSSFWFRRGFAEIAQDPVDWTRLLAKKTFLFHGNTELMDTVDYRVFREVTPMLWLAPVSFGVIVALAVPGLFFSRRLIATPMLTLVLIGSAASVVAFFVFGRYRLPAVTIYVLFAAVAIDRIIGFANSRSWRPLVLTVVTALAMFTLSLVPVSEANPAMSYNTLAGMYSRIGDLESAHRHLDRAVGALPDHPELRHNLANIMMKQGDHCGAAEQYRIAAVLRRTGPTEVDPIVLLQAYERVTAREEALRACGALPEELEGAVEERRLLARSLLEHVAADRLQVSEELRLALETVAGDERPTPR
jgi:4-amino-4-deoxy-L-arabinose transferase-like glycosyltransferase